MNDSSAAIFDQLAALSSEAPDQHPAEPESGIPLTDAARRQLGTLEFAHPVPKESETRKVPRRLRKRVMIVRAFGGPPTAVEIYKAPRQKDVWRPSRGRTQLNACEIRCRLCKRAGGTLVKHEEFGAETYEHRNRSCVS